MCGQVPTKTCHESNHEFVDQMKSNLEVVHEKARKKMILANGNQKQKYDTKTKQNMYTPEQHVWIASKTEPKEDVQTTLTNSMALILC